MSETELKQHLAAILAADVAGYSRLMATDERATVAALDAGRSVFRTQIDANKGRVIDMAGDSVMAIFDTAVGAVTAALAIQKEINLVAAATPEERRMQFRIGIHLGDIIAKDDGTIYGSGVNIAARLESLADYGGITVSGMIQEAVRNRIPATFVDQGDQEVKNIPHPVRAYRINVDGSRPAPIKPKTEAESVGDIDALLDRTEQLKQLLKQKFERRLTVMFTDLKDASELAEQESGLSSRVRIKKYQDIVTTATRENDGVLVKNFGNGTLSHFADAQSALRTAVNIQRSLDEFNLNQQPEALLLVRIGMHTGDCYLEKDEIFGDVVNIASLIKEKTQAGEILISETTYRALADKSETYCRHHMPLTIKGKADPINTHKVFWDPDEADKDKTGPVAEPIRKARMPIWKLALLLGVPILIVLAISLVYGTRNKSDSDTRRSVIHSLPSK